MSTGLPSGHPLLMHEIITSLAQATTSTTTKGNSGSGGSSITLLVIIGVFAVVYFAFVRPRSQRARQQQQKNRQLSVGDEVMSAGGIFGRVIAVDSDAVEVEVSPGVVLTFLPRAVSLKPKPAGGATAAPAEPVDEPWESGPGGGATDTGLPPAGQPPVTGQGDQPGGAVPGRELGIEPPGEEPPGGATPTKD